MPVFYLVIFAALAHLGCSDAVGEVISAPTNRTDSAPPSDTQASTDTSSETEPTLETDTETSAIDSDTAIPTDSTPFNGEYLLGADISWVQEQEDQGVRFIDDGEEKDIILLLRDHGFNGIRLRIFHSPENPYGYQFDWGTKDEPYCNLSHTLEMAKRAKDAGMIFFLNFHYSDTWADPDSQVKPADWEGLAFDDLLDALYRYTRDTVGAFSAESVLPDLVQLGNEITPGMLHPEGKTFDPDNWDQLAELLKAAHTAVKEVDPRIKTVIHLDRGHDFDTTAWWLEEAKSRGVVFDILAQSTYTRWHGEPSDWRAAFQATTDAYPDMELLIAEYADNHREVNDIMRETPRGLGTFLWEPTADGEWGEGLFDMPQGEGEATPRQTLFLYDQMAEDYGLRAR